MKRYMQTAVPNKLFIDFTVQARREQLTVSELLEKAAQQYVELKGKEEQKAERIDSDL